MNSPLPRLLPLLCALCLLLTGMGCNEPQTPPPFAVSTQAEAEALAQSTLPEYEWRHVTQWLQLDNGNVWLLTRQKSKNDSEEINPCIAKNLCLVESWIVDPEKEIAYLSSSQNEYLARINVTTEPQHDGFLRVDWDILSGNVSTTQLNRTEYINEEDGTLQ